MSADDDIRQYLITSRRWLGPANELTPTYRLIENDVLDSFGIFELIGFLEDDFGIRVEDVDLVPANFETIEAIARLVADKAAR